MKEMCFTFGSNEAGIHGAGAAAYAYKNRKAVWGVGYGQTGQAFAIPTKDKQIQTLPLSAVQEYVDRFLDHARQNPHIEFQVTRIGCGLAGFTDEEIAPLFADAPPNCLFDEAWKPFLPTQRFWGTF
jgi:hypothetical protein